MNGWVVGVTVTMIDKQMLIIIPLEISLTVEHRDISAEKCMAEDYKDFILI